MRTVVAVWSLCLAVAVVAPATSARAAKACSLDVIAGAPQSASGKVEAQRLARQNWRNSTAARLGPLWSNWNIADDRSIACRGGGGRIECRAHATPCKELGTDPGGPRYRLVR
jgi:hypothetical protein